MSGRLASELLASGKVDAAASDAMGSDDKGGVVLLEHVCTKALESKTADLIW